MSEKHKIAAVKRGTARTAELGERVVQAMATIEAEMKANGGIYPHNGGAVSVAELVRRAAINESSVYKKHPANEALKAKIEVWLKTLAKEEAVGRGRVRKTLAERNEAWKAKYHALEQRHIRTELELQALQSRTEKLLAENGTLLEQLRAAGASKVTSIRKGK